MSFKTPSPKRRGELAKELATHSQIVKSVGSERNNILRMACDIGGNKRRRLLDMVTSVNNDMINTSKQIDDVLVELVPLVPRKDDESWEERHQRETIERKHKMLHQLQKTMNRLTSSFDKANADLEELDAAESEEAGNQW